MMLASGIPYAESYSLVEREDGSGLTILIDLTDGGSAALFISFDEIEKRAYPVLESEHAPTGVTLQ